MKLGRFACMLLLALTLFSTAARADVLVPGQKPPRNEYSEAFVRLYADSITGWDRANDGILDGVEEIVLWRYPGSGWMTRTIDAEWFRHSERGLDEYLDTCYMDGQGRLWAYVGYAYGRQLAWACLSDPANESLPADPETTEAVEREARVMFWREKAPAAILTAGAIAVTGVFLYVFWYRKKTKGRRP